MIQINARSRRVTTLPYLLSNAADEYLAAHAIAGGKVVAHAFANFYVISTRPDAATVRRVNLMKGRPADQVGSVTTTRQNVPGLFDWSRLPEGLTRATVMGLMDTLFELGPFGFRGPAAAGMPAHLTSPDGDVRTTQVIAPGYACRSNKVLARALEMSREQFLYITSANRSRHLTGAEDEPAQFRADGLQAEFGHEPDFLVLRHRSETAARRAYPLHAPMSTTILAFHKLAEPGGDGRPRLVVERHGSLPLDTLRCVAARFGFGLALGPKATQRLAQREYAEREYAEENDERGAA